ncbi:MAG: phosphoglycerate mutase family protein [Bdellovibrionaceae bacterium]|nr:phosphoglycerate mutase family protein [Pseudobdellovibrionaceae bacterium]
MIVCFIRHATRNTFDSGDGSLNERGRQQAQELIGRVAPSGPLPRPTHLFCSPKKRAQETLQPLAHALKLPLTVESALDERATQEPVPDFTKRIRQWLSQLESAHGAQGVVYICSHLDVLETALIVIDSNLSELEIERGLSPAESRVFEVHDGFWNHMTAVFTRQQK